MGEMSPLRRRMVEDMTIRNLSPATQRSYVHAVSKFSQYFCRSPDRLGLEDVRAYQVHLASKGVAWASLNQVVCALRFFYGVTLGQQTIPERIAYAREPRKLPTVLRGDEVVQFLESVSSLKARVALTTAYAAGLAGFGSRGAEGLRRRQRAHGDADRARQGRQGALRDALGTAAEHPAQLLAVGAAAIVPVSRPHAGQADRDDGAACGLPLGSGRGGARQARQRACSAPQLRHPSAGERRRHSHHPGSARTREPVDDGALYARLRSAHRQYRESPRSADFEGDAARIRGDGAAGVRTGRRLPPPWRGLRTSERRTSRTRRTAGHQRDHGLPHGGARRPCRTMRGLRPHPHRL